MKRRGDFKVENYKTWIKDKDDYKIKSKLIRDHFQKILKGDSVLVLNYEKKGMPGYIGGNVLMEMAMAFWHKKPIYILNPVSGNAPLKEEIFGMRPIFLNGDITKIS